MGLAYTSICALPCSGSTCEVCKTVFGSLPYVQQTPKREKRSAWPFLATDLESGTGEKWLDVGDAVWVPELLNKAIVSVPSQHNSVNLPLRYCK